MQSDLCRGGTLLRRGTYGNLLESLQLQVVLTGWQGRPYSGSCWRKLLLAGDRLVQYLDHDSSHLDVTRLCVNEEPFSWLRRSKNSGCTDGFPSGWKEPLLLESIGRVASPPRVWLSDSQCQPYLKNSLKYVHRLRNLLLPVVHAEAQVPGPLPDEKDEEWPAVNSSITTRRCTSSNISPPSFCFAKGAYLWAGESIGPLPYIYGGALYRFVRSHHYS